MSNRTLPAGLPKWGINWLGPFHKDQQDMPHVAAMGYGAFVLYEMAWGDAGFCAELLAHAPADALFLLRDHPLSEQKDDDFRRDPYAKGVYVANQWIGKVQQGRIHLPVDRCRFMGLNEVDTNAYAKELDLFTLGFVQRLNLYGMGAAAYDLGVGHPSTLTGNAHDDPNWAVFAASAAAILGDPLNVVSLHEYGAPEMGGYGWGYWCDRLAYCPYPFKVVITECGIDNGVVDAGNLKGYAVFDAVKDRYVEWLDGYQLGMQERSGDWRVQVLAYCIFAFDHGAGETKDWHSFDVRPLRQQLEAKHWSVAQKQPTKVHLPIIDGGDGEVVTPDLFDRVMDFIAQWEGGYSDNELDPGNWTGGEVGLGVLKGTKYGISAASYPDLDIAHLTREEANAIYRRDYWGPSGAAHATDYATALLLMDSGVLHGTGAPAAWVREYGLDPWRIAARRLRVYTGHKDAQWFEFGRGWVNRTAALLEEIGANQ